MSPDFQTFASLVIVAVAAAWLGWRAFGRRRPPGCSDDCGCAGPGLKIKPEQAKPAAKISGHRPTG